MATQRLLSGSATNTSYTYPATSNLLTNVKQGTTWVRAFTYDAAGDTTQDTRGSQPSDAAFGETRRVVVTTLPFSRSAG